LARSGKGINASFILRQKLQRDNAVELGVLGFVNDAHATLAELFEYLVV
jgi:hypothetical protein